VRSGLFGGVPSACCAPEAGMPARLLSAGLYSHFSRSTSGDSVSPRSTWWRRAAASPGGDLSGHRQEADIAGCGAAAGDAGRSRRGGAPRNGAGRPGRTGPVGTGGGVAGRAAGGTAQAGADRRGDGAAGARDFRAVEPGGPPPTAGCRTRPPEEIPSQTPSRPGGRSRVGAGPANMPAAFEYIAPAATTSCTPTTAKSATSRNECREAGEADGPDAFSRSAPRSPPCGSAQMCRPVRPCRGTKSDPSYSREPGRAVTADRCPAAAMFSVPSMNQRNRHTRRQNLARRRIYGEEWGPWSAIRARPGRQVGLRPRRHLIIRSASGGSPLPTP
jgi:hypothetical protein